MILNLFYVWWTVHVGTAVFPQITIRSNPRWNVTSTLFNADLNRGKDLVFRTCYFEIGLFLQFCVVLNIVGDIHLSNYTDSICDRTKMIYWISVSYPKVWFHKKIISFEILKTIITVIVFRLQVLRKESCQGFFWFYIAEFTPFVIFRLPIFRWRYIRHGYGCHQWVRLNQKYSSWPWMFKNIYRTKDTCLS